MNRRYFMQYVLGAAASAVAAFRVLRRPKSPVAVEKPLEGVSAGYDLSDFRSRVLEPAIRRQWQKIDSLKGKG